MQLPPMNIGVESGYGPAVIEAGIVRPALWILLPMQSTVPPGSRKSRKDGVVPSGFGDFWSSFAGLPNKHSTVSLLTGLHHERLYFG